MAKFKALTPLLHEGQVIQVGDEVELGKDVNTDRLIELDAIEAVETKKEDSKKK